MSDEILRGVAALKQAITDECVKRGGACNSTPDWLLAVNATFDPAIIVQAVLDASGRPAPPKD